MEIKKNGGASMLQDKGPAVSARGFGMTKKGIAREIQMLEVIALDARKAMSRLRQRTITQPSSLGT